MDLRKKSPPNSMDEITKGHIARCKGEITDIDKNIRTIYKDNQEVPYYAFSIETRCLNNTQKPMYQVWCKFIEKFYPASKEMGFSFLFDDPENKICLRFDEANMLEHYNLYPEKIYKIDFSFPDINSNSSSHMNIKSARDLKELLEKFIDTKIPLNEIRVPKKIKKLVFSSYHIIETGERGVVLRLGKFTKIMDEGLNFKIPFMEKVIPMNIRDEKLTLKLEVSSSDIQSIIITESLVYALNPEAVGKIYQTYGTKYSEILLRPMLSENPIEQFVEKRTEISNKIRSEFINRMKDTGIIVKSLNLTDHDFSDEYNKAIEAKKVAEQGALKAKYDLERVTLEAEAQMKKQKSLNELVLREKAIDKWDGKLPQYYSGDNLPFISSK